ncbi:MAG: DNA polymerase III subunit delta [Eubacteriaceae bacterium]|nr:DNA polymerase III subunit delta [Eubacteriaceae bacterium]
MAYNTRHAFETIGEDIKNGKTGNLFFLRGKEQYLVEWACDTIIKKYVNEATRTLDLVRFEPGAFDMDAVIEACETIPLFSEKKVVILDNFYLLWGKDRDKQFDEEKRDIFKDYIREIPDTAILVVAVPAAPTYKLEKYGNSTSKALAAAGKEYDFGPLSGRQLLGFMKKRLVAGGKTASRATMEMLIAESGYLNEEIDYGLFQLDNDLKKIMALAEGDEIRPEDVMKGISDNLEHNTFKLLDSICSNRKAEGFRLIRELLLSGHSTFELLGGIINQLELMQEVKEMKNLGSGVPQMAKILGKHQYPIKKAIGFSEKYSEAQVKSMLQKAFEVEKNIKRGILKEEMALEMFVARI